MLRFLAVALAGASIATPAWASGGGGELMPPVLLGLAVVLLAARLGADLAARAGQPPVLGELLAGVALGAAAGFGPAWVPGVWQNPGLDAMAGVGVCLLLFEVGLESTVDQMKGVGLPSLAVAGVGVLAPFMLGWAASAWMLPEQSPYVHAFLGAALTATSVGITARVLRDTRSSQSTEARIILGAAVIDDVLGLIVLALVASAVRHAGSGEPFSVATIWPILAKAALFLASFVALGQRLVPVLFSWAGRLHGHRVHLVLAVSCCFFAAYLASLAGLAPIVGAYAAGLVLEPRHLIRFTDRGESSLEELLHPVTAFLVPVFFVVMGMQVDVKAFLQFDTLCLATALLAAAVLGKMACALVVPAGADGLTVALGMVPRGEVGLIFANAGLSLFVAGHRLLDETSVSALVAVVIVTTLVTPPALRWAVARSRGAAPDPAVPLDGAPAATAR